MRLLEKSKKKAEHFFSSEAEQESDDEERMIECLRLSGSCLRVITSLKFQAWVRLVSLRNPAHFEGLQTAVDNAYQDLRHNH